MSKKTLQTVMQAANKAGYEVECVVMLNQKHEPDEDDIDPTAIGGGTTK